VGLFTSKLGEFSLLCSNNEFNNGQLDKYDRRWYSR
jgi:hypothetical protein